MQLPVCVRGIQLGRAVDLLLHPTEPRGVGLDVLCGDERHRFLAFAAAKVGNGRLEVDSPLALLDLRSDSPYRLETRPLSELRGKPVADGSSLQDVVLAGDWSIAALVLDDQEVPLDGIALPPRRSR